MNSTLAQVGNLAPRELIAAMSDSVHAFVAGAEQSDDLTMLDIQFIKTIED